MPLSDQKMQRYARQIILPQIGRAGQERLAQARVLVVGAGGLGSPVLLYLAAAGVGTLGIVDDDRVELSNLQRQVLHETGDVGRAKVQSAADALLELNPEITVRATRERLDDANVAALFADYDIIADGSDNFATRFLVADACHRMGKILVSAAVQGFIGQLSTFKSHLGAPHPCYRCLHPRDGGEGQTCVEAGILGSVAGVMGTLQATEVVKELLGIGESLSGRLVLFDALKGETRSVRLPRDPACACCG